MLTASAITLAGLAGCTGSDNTNAAGSESSPVVAAVEEFYTVLYEENDIEGANAMYHPDSNSREISPADFESFGGIDSIEADIVSTEIIREGEETARVHVDVGYVTPIGGTTNTDWFTLRTHDGEWLIDYYLSDEARSDLSEERIEELMDQS
jgi:hypothetical protein